VDRPQTCPVIDLRSEVYDAWHHIKNARAMQVLPGWDRFVDSSGASNLLVLNGSAIAEALHTRRGLTQLDVDKGFVLLKEMS